jgi:hypothetical protein
MFRKKELELHTSFYWGFKYVSPHLKGLVDKMV